MKIDAKAAACRPKIREECAVFGVSLKTDKEAAGIVYNGLLSLQHRGQEGAGIAVSYDNHIICHKDIGLVSEVFTAQTLAELPKSGVAVGHTRYSTTGTTNRVNVGPFVSDYLTGRIAAAHNGNLTNAAELRGGLLADGIRFDASCDSEVISSLIAYCITQEHGTIKGSVRAARQLRGAYSLVIISGKGKLIAIRDPNGFRPLCIGQSESGCAVASESCALEACGFKFVRDVASGEVVVIENGEIASAQIALTNKEEGRGLCIFEYVYLARPDSVIDGLSVYAARYNMGAILAEESPVDADIVCGVPDSGLDAAAGYSAKSGIPLTTGFVRNRYIGRSFIYPLQSQRDSAVRLKLNPLSANVTGKRIVLVDDSVVRGTTNGRIVRSLKNAGAAEVHMRIASPPIRHTCRYGTDIDSEDNLIANKMPIDEIARTFGADSLSYLTEGGLRKACGGSSLPFCTACFTGAGDYTRDKKDIFEHVT